MSRTLIALIFVAGLALVAAGVALNQRRSLRSIALRLQLPYAEHDESLLREGIQRLSRLVALGEPAKNPNEPSSARTGNAVRLAIIACLLGGLSVLATGKPQVGLVAGAGVIGSVTIGTRLREQRREARLRQQLPHALTTLASSLEAGAPLERSLDLLSRRSPEPLASELAQLGSEVAMGVELADALERMSVRMRFDDLRWWIYAVRLQRKVGGPLAPITRVLADSMAEREELRQQVRVLTAEGRVSAYVLGALPVLVVLAVQVSTPGYLSPFFEGWGLVVLMAMTASVLVGIWTVLQMVKGDLQ